MDEDWARIVLDQEEAGGEVAPAADPDKIDSLHYSPEVALLALIADRTLAVRSAIFAAQSEKPEGTVDTLPRPTTALERLREERAFAELLEVERQILGGGIEIQT